jgi:hypothetical protein
VKCSGKLRYSEKIIKTVEIKKSLSAEQSVFKKPSIANENFRSRFCVVQEIECKGPHLQIEIL